MHLRTNIYNSHSKTMGVPIIDVEMQTIKCICDSVIEKEDEAMVECEKCHNWLHLGCLKLTEETIPNIFHCPACESASKLSKMDSARDFQGEMQEDIEEEEGYQIASFEDLKEKQRELLEGYMVSCKKPDNKMKMADIVERILEMEDYLDQTEAVLQDDRAITPYADKLLEMCEKYTSNEKDIKFINLAHGLLGKLGIHNNDKIKEMRSSIDQMKASYPSYF